MNIILATPPIFHINNIARISRNTKVTQYFNFKNRIRLNQPRWANHQGRLRFSGSQSRESLPIRDRRPVFYTYGISIHKNPHCPYSGEEDSPGIECPVTHSSSSASQSPSDPAPLRGRVKRAAATRLQGTQTAQSELGLIRASSERISYLLHMGPMAKPLGAT